MDVVDSIAAVSNGNENGHNIVEPSQHSSKRPQLKSSNDFSNRVTVVLGAQWGDEGKGKVVDMLAGDADIVARCQVIIILLIILQHFLFNSVVDLLIASVCF